MDERMNGRIDEWKNGRTDEWMLGGLVGGWVWRVCV